MDDVDSILSNKKKFYKFSKSLIKEYFDYAEKRIVFKNIKFKDLGKERIMHIVSTYLMGLVFIDELLSSDEKAYDTDEDIRLIWFISCLYHDIGYVFENLKDSEKKIENLNDFKIKYKIENDILSQGDVKVLNYKTDTVKDYFQYRLEKYGKMDHGISGGILLYDRLIKIFSERMKQQSVGEYKNKNVKFVKSDKEHYKMISRLIIEHNIWLYDDEFPDTLEYYKEYKLKELIKNDINDSPIKYYDEDIYSKLFYIFCIADTLEPIKDKEDIDKMNDLKSYLDKFKLEVNPEGEITIRINTGIDDKLKKITSLEKWLKVKIKKNNNEDYSECTITLKKKSKVDKRET